MKTHGWRALAGTVLLAFSVTGILTGCNGRVSPDSGPGAKAAAAKTLTVPDHFKAVLAKLSLPVKEEFSGGPQLGTILLIGENHASVETQRQLVKIISDLRERGACDVVLVEGSSGPISASSIKTPSGAAIPPWKKDAEYWQPQLEWGLIAAYEYALLVDPSIPVVGVEDMTEKAKFEVEHVERLDRDIKEEVEAYRRGYDFLVAAFPRLSNQGNADAVRTARKVLDSHKQALDEASSSAERYAKSVDPAISLEKDAITARAEIIRLIHKAGVEPRDEASVADTKLRQALSPDEQTTLIKSAEKLDDAEKRLETIAKEAEPLLKAVDNGLEQLRDAHFASANALIDLNPASDQEAEGIRNFFAKDLQARREKAQKQLGVEDLKGRDQAMVANAIAELRKRGAKSGVLIVGYAHLEGVASGLKAANCSFVTSLPPSALMETELWENAAFRARSRAYIPQFAGKTTKGEENKPPTVLQDPRWIKDQQNRQRLFGTIQSSKPALTDLASGGRTFEGILGPDSVMRVSGLRPDRNAMRGSHVIAIGEVPGRPGEFFEIIDREVGRKIAKKFSTARNRYAYQKVTAINGQKRTVFYIDDTDRSFQEFAHTAPGGAGGGEPPRRVVVFGESDFLEENGNIVSPVWRELRTGGGGDEPPEPPSWASLSSPERDPRKGGRISVLRTTNVQRANSKLALIEMQRPAKPADLRVLYEADLSRIDKLLHFTPRTGEHAQVVTIVAKNTPEFRAALRRAADAKLLENKQVALITCGDAFPETAELREMLLRSGVLMVWTPSRQITPSAGNKLAERVKASAGTTLLGERVIDIDELMESAIRTWKRDIPNDPDLQPLLDAGSWVFQCRKSSELKNA